MVLIGLGGQATRVDTRRVVRRQLALRGSLIYDHPGDFAAKLELGHPITGTDSAGQLSTGLRRRKRCEAARYVPGKTWIKVTS